MSSARVGVVGGSMSKIYSFIPCPGTHFLIFNLFFPSFPTLLFVQRGIPVLDISVNVDLCSGWIWDLLLKGLKEKKIDQKNTVP